MGDSWVFFWRVQISKIAFLWTTLDQLLKECEDIIKIACVEEREQLRSVLNEVITQNSTGS